MKKDSKNQRKIGGKTKNQKKPEDETRINITTIVDVAHSLIPIIEKKLVEVKWKNVFLQLFFKNKLLKISTFVIACVLFFYVESQDLVESNFSIPLDMKITNDLTVANEVPSNITVYLRGAKNSLFALDVNKMHAEIVIQEDNHGEYKYRPVLKNIPEDIKILRISPQNIDITLSSVQRKLLNIEPELVGVPHPDYYLVRYSISPRRLWVTGPNEILDDTTSLKTEPISIEGQRSNKEIKVKLNRSTHPLINVDAKREFSIFLYLRSRFLKERYTENLEIKASLENQDLYIENRDLLVVTNLEYELLSEYAENFEPQEEFSFYLNTSEITGPGEYQLPVVFEKIRKARVKTYSPVTLPIVVRSLTAGDKQPVLQGSSNPSSPK